MICDFLSLKKWFVTEAHRQGDKTVADHCFLSWWIWFKHNHLHDLPGRCIISMSSKPLNPHDFQLLFYLEGYLMSLVVSTVVISLLITTRRLGLKQSIWRLSLAILQHINKSLNFSTYSYSRIILPCQSVKYMHRWEHPQAQASQFWHGK